MPNLLPDEYLYAALGRSIGETGRPLVRGGSAHFPALLEPLVASPLWLVHDVGTAYRLVQLLNACAMSLAAVPVFLLARRLRASVGFSLAAAALSVAGPQLLLAGSVLSEPIAYPLALGALAAGVALVERPGGRTAATFLALAGLASFSRVQLAVLPVCVLAAAAAAGIRERRLSAALREQPALLATVVLGAAALAALAASQRLGYYATASPDAARAGAALRIGGVDLYELALWSGPALIPGALAGLAAAFVRPRCRAELAFATVAAAFGATLVAEAVLYGDTTLVQERYLVYAVPLASLALATRRPGGSTQRRLETAAVAALAVVAATVPLAGYAAAAQHTETPFLFAFDRLDEAVGQPGTASLIVALAATGLALAGSLALRAGRTGAVLALTGIVSLAAFAAAVSFDRDAALRARSRLLPADVSWIDHAHVGDVSFLASTGTPRIPTLETLFWNRSVKRMLVLPATAPPDKFAVSRLAIRPDGTLLAAGAPIARPLVVDEHLTTVELRGGATIARGRDQRLWRPAGRARLAAVMPGRLPDGSLLGLGALIVWPDRGVRFAGRLELRLHAASGGGTLELLHPSYGTPARIDVPGGATRTFRVAVCGTGPWHSPFRASGGLSTSRPRFVADASACPR